MRKPIRIFVFLVSLGNLGGLWAEDTLASVSNIQICRISEAPPISLVVVNDPAMGPIWGIIRRDVLHVPDFNLAIPGRLIQRLTASPDMESLLVIAASEGHTMMAVFDLADIRSLRYDGLAQRISPIFRFDPYPDNVFFEAWDGNEALVLIDGEGPNIRRRWSKRLSDFVDEPSETP